MSHPKERKLTGMYFGIPEAREDAIMQLKEALEFAVRHNKPGAFVLAGPQHVGKTSAVFELEKLLYKLGLELDKDFIHINPNDLYTLKSVDVGTVILDEIPVKNIQSLYKASYLLEKGKRVILDVVNKNHSLGDPRNNTELDKIIRDIFPYSLLHLKQLFAVQTGMEIPAKVPVKSKEFVDFDSNPQLKNILERHRERVKECLKFGIFVAEDTFVSEEGNLVTPLTWTGKPTYGSTEGQSITSYIDPSLL